MRLERNLLNLSENFLGKLCERMPLDITLYEEESICTIERESCGYYKQEGEAHLCNKPTYTFIPHSVG